MKTVLSILGLVCASLLLAAPAAKPAPAKVTANATNRFEISGMHCDGCAKGLTTELKLTPGVATATVTFTNRLGIVAFDTNRLSTEKLVKVMREAGYEAKLVRR
jgi:copper chaperone CopZ